MYQEVEPCWENGTVSEYVDKICDLATDLWEMAIEAWEKAEKKWEEYKQKLIDAMEKYNQAQAAKERDDAVLQTAMEKNNKLEQEAKQLEDEFNKAEHAYAEALQAKN